VELITRLHKAYYALCEEMGELGVEKQGGNLSVAGAWRLPVVYTTTPRSKSGVW